MTVRAMQQLGMQPGSGASRGSISDIPQMNLVRSAQAIWGNSIAGMWVRDDILYDTTGYVTLYPARIGPNLHNIQPGRMKVRTINGRISMFAELGGAGDPAICLANPNLAVMKSVIVTAKSAAPFGAGNYRHIVQAYFNDGVGQALIGAAGTSAWYVNGWTHYYNGNASEDASASDFSIYEGVNASGSLPGITVGGILAGSPLRNYTSDIGTIIALTATSTAQQRSDGVAMLKAYDNIP